MGRRRRVGPGVPAPCLRHARRRAGLISVGRGTGPPLRRQLGRGSCRCPLDDGGCAAPSPPSGAVGGWPTSTKPGGGVVSTPVSGGPPLLGNPAGVTAGATLVNLVRQLGPYGGHPRQAHRRRPRLPGPTKHPSMVPVAPWTPQQVGDAFAAAIPKAERWRSRPPEPPESSPPPTRSQTCTWKVLGLLMGTGDCFPDPICLYCSWGGV